MHVLTNLMIINNTYWERDLYLNSQNPTYLHFFSNNSELYNISFQSRNHERLRKQDFILSFFELVTRSNFST